MTKNFRALMGIIIAMMHAPVWILNAMWVATKEIKKRFTEASKEDFIGVYDEHLDFIKEKIVDAWMFVWKYTVKVYKAVATIIFKYYKKFVRAVSFTVIFIVTLIMLLLINIWDSFEEALFIAIDTSRE